MYIGKLKPKQIKEMIKTMLLLEAKSEPYYTKNLSSILNSSLAEYEVKHNNGNDYVIAKINNGDIFVFDDCSYIKFKTPNFAPVSLQKNTNVYLNFMRDNFEDYYSYETEYNMNIENVVNFINFCDDLVYTTKKNTKNEEAELVM